MERAKHTYHHVYTQMVAALILSWVVACGVASYALFKNYQQARLNAEVSVGNLAHSLENFLRVHFKVAELILQQAASKYHAQNNQQFNATAFSKTLGELRQLLPNNAGLRASDENGNVIYGTDLPPGKPLSIAERKFFEEARSTGKLVFGLPLKSRVTGEQVLPMALRLQKPDGSFGGVVYINTDANAIANAFQSLDVGPNGTVALFDQDRRVYLRLPNAPTEEDEKELRFDAPETREAIAQGKTEAIFQATGSLDGVQRTIGIRKVGDYPLYVLASLGKEDYLATWWSNARNNVLLLLFVATIGSAFCIALRGSWKDHKTALNSLLDKDAELLAAKESAEAATVAKSNFLANMSHEIRTPMNGILGMAYLMRRGCISPLQAQQLDTIAASGKHLLGIINDVLDLSKIEADKLLLEENDFALADVLHDVSAVVGGNIRAKGLVLVIEMPCMPPALHGDATRLRQILVNYLSNALKFTERGSITLRGSVLEEQAHGYLLRFEVSDTGIGITAEEKERLFAAFEQADKSTTRKYGGTGLGLAINRRLARLMGGEVGFDSTPGHGSTFWLIIPLAQGQEAVAGKSEHAVHDAESLIRDRYRGQRVLVAEDEPINQEVTAELLREVGLEPAIAENGLKALQMAEQESFALILMDMQMPEMDGVAATGEIRKLPGREATPILAMTANAFNEDREQCFVAGMNDFISKPVDPEVFFATLLKWLAQTRQPLSGHG